jgi:hypothetical protein
MKKMFVIIAAMFLSSAVYAQVHVNFNLGSHPSWGRSGYNSHRVIIYHRQPVPYNVIYRTKTYSGYESYPMQKHDNGKHNGWYKGNNGNDRGNDNGYYNGNGYDNGSGKSNGNYNGNGYDNGSGNGNGTDNDRGNDNSYYNNNNDNGNSNGNSNENKNDVVVPDKYK